MTQYHYDIFREQLAIRFPAHGYALWEPSPLEDLYRVAGVGDVGYISEGRFHRLFNILLPADDPTHENFGVPENFKTFKPKVQKHVIAGILRHDNFCSAGVTLESDEYGPGQFATRPRDPGEVSFSCRGKQGAVLSLPIQAKRENTVVRKDFGKWMVEHIDQWFAWVRDKGLEIDRMEDIILVTGTDRTRSWANVAFLGGQADARVSFGVEVDHSRINWQFSSERKAGAAWNWGPSGENLPEDQCVFIRGFRVARKRIFLWSRLKAAAGPNPDPKDDDCEPDVELISIPAVPKYRDPLHVILEYIAEERRDCDMVIVHDDELAVLDLLGDGASLEALQPDVVLSYLRSSKPVIHEVMLGLDLLSANNFANADTEIFRVASLSPTFEGDFSRNFESESSRIIATNSLQTPIVTSERLTTGSMSLPLHSHTSSSHVKRILDAALSEYQKKTKNDLFDNWLAKELQSCDSAEAVLEIIQHQAEASDKFREGDKTLMKWIGSLVHVVYKISSTLGEGVGMAFPTVKAVSTAIGLLLATAKDVRESHDVLVDFFERIQSPLQSIPSQISPTEDMVKTLVKIIADILFILSFATKEMQRSRTKRFLRKLQGRRDMEDALKRLDKFTQEVRIAMDSKKGNEDVLEMGKNVSETKWIRMRADLRYWLSPLDTTMSHLDATEFHQEGTAAWFFESSKFKEWELIGSLLWIHGIPGSGKSVLCSAIINHVISLRDAGLAALAYFYFDSRDTNKQDLRSFVTSILTQLSAYSETCCDIIFRLYSTHEEGAQQPATGALINCLKEMLKVVTQPVYIIIDALDMCPNISEGQKLQNPREALLDFLKDLVGLHVPNLHICVTSRLEIDIKLILEPLANCSFSLHDESGQRKDISDYVRNMVYSDRKRRKWRAEDKKVVVEELSVHADGM
ncbi:hypothetical protein EI94DRAFT_1688024 [Lactarius quietus]|nr:hypothetical protein EI94DRAFT_1688024 [Lactarius quietus]